MRCHCRRSITGTRLARHGRVSCVGSSLLGMRVSGRFLFHFREARRREKCSLQKGRLWQGCSIHKHRMTVLTVEYRDSGSPADSNRTHISIFLPSLDLDWFQTLRNVTLCSFIQFFSITCHDARRITYSLLYTLLLLASTSTFVHQLLFPTLIYSGISWNAFGGV